MSDEPKLTEGCTQTILASDPKREGNCLSACVASYFGIDLAEVPHFIEHGQDWRPDPDENDRIIWWAMLCGYVAGRGLWPVELENIAEGERGELLFVAGPSPRGVFHQVLYRDGALWHDPHPSRDGLTEIVEVLALRPMQHDHTPTSSEDT